MKTHLSIALAVCLGFGSVPGLSTNLETDNLHHSFDSLPAPAAQLPRSTPEAQGVSSAAILSFLEAANKEINSLHSFMLLRHGNVVAEGWWSPYNPQSPHMLFSLSKSFTSTAIGLAIAEGKLSVDDPVLKFFPDDAPAEPSANLKAMRVRDLLRVIGELRCAATPACDRMPTPTMDFFATRSVPSTRAAGQYAAPRRVSSIAWT